MVSASAIQLTEGYSPLKEISLAEIEELELHALRASRELRTFVPNRLIEHGNWTSGCTGGDR